MRFSLKTLLGGLFGLLAILALGQGLLAMTALGRINVAVQDVTRNWLPSIEALSNLRFVVASTRTQQYRYLTARTDEDRATSLRELDTTFQTLAQTRKVYEPLISDDAERRIYTEFAQNWDAVQQVWQTILATAQAGHSAEAMAQFWGDARKPYAAATDAIAKDVAFNRDGALASAAAIGSVEDTARATTIAMLAVVLAAAVGAIAFGFLGISRPITQITQAMRALAGGDATVAVPGAGRRDEIGAMAGTLAVFKENLVRTRKLEEETVLARAGAEAQRKAAMIELADGFEQAVGSVIGMVSSAATELQGTAQAMSATAGETASQSTTVAAAAEEAASNVNTVAAAAEELGSSVQEIGRQVGGSADLARMAVTEAEQTAGLVQTLSVAAAEIGNVVALISSIAGQTNLLALNATIEAARAGEAGRGFAVVASEVKELASQTARATDEISTQIARIQGSTGQAVTAIDAITGRIREISGVATSLSAAVEEQGAATQEIIRNVSQAAMGTGEVTANIVSVASAADETGAAASQVLASASELSRQSEHLRSEVSRFLGTVRAA